MTKNRLKKTVALGLGLICTFNFNVSEGLTETNSKANLKNSILEKNNNLENKNFLNTRKTSKNNNQDNLNKYLKYGAIGVGLLGGACSLYELGVLIRNRMSKPVEPEKEIPPFAGLQWASNNCYVNAILQVLYEDPGYRNYIKNRSAQIKNILNDSSLENLKNKKNSDQERKNEFSNKIYECKLNLLKADTDFYNSNKEKLDDPTAKNTNKIGSLYRNWCIANNVTELDRTLEKFQNVISQKPGLTDVINELVNAIRNFDEQNKKNCDSTTAFLNARADRCIKRLDSVFDSMGKYKGSCVPISERKEFELSIDHYSQQRDVTEVLEYFLFNNPSLPLNRYNYLYELGTSFNTQVDSFDIDNHDNKSCIIDIGRSEGSDGDMGKNKFAITLPEQIKNKKLKAIALHSGSTGNGGHWVAYKADDNGAWWKCDGSSVTKEFSDTKSFINNTYIKQNVALAYYQNQ